MTLAVNDISPADSAYDAEELRQVQDDNNRLQSELKDARREAERLRFKLESIQHTDSFNRTKGLNNASLANAVDVSSQVPVECLSESSNDLPQAHTTLAVQPTNQKPTPAQAQPQLTLASASNQRRSSAQAKQRARKARRDRAANEAPGSTRYWSDSEHQLFLEALKIFGHKDLKSISAHVGTRNMTQVRTHTQKYFMKLMREAKRRSASEAPATTMEIEREASEAAAETTNDVRSVPETCGVSLLCLVAQETFASR